MSSAPISILQTNPKANYLAHKAEIDAAIDRVLQSGWYILGQEVTAFESEFAAYVGVNHSIGVASGTDAIELALRACGVGPGDLVFTVSHTAVATVAAVERTGAKPVLVDIDPATFTMDPNRLEDAIRAYQNRSSVGRPRAVLPVHLYGHPADMPAITQIAQRYGLYVVEDCAQAHGAAIEGRKTGCWGDVAAFSFYPTKNLGALGDGGMVVTDRADWAERARSLRQYGWKQRYISEMVGANSRLDELQAAILRVKLGHLDSENERRRQLARMYSDGLSKTPLLLPICRPDVTHVYHQYVVRAPKRDALQSYLRERGIGTLIHYPQPVHAQPAYAGRVLTSGALRNSEEAAAQVLSLPLYPELADTLVESIIDVIGCWPGNAG